jgi:hypothetical protein
MKKMLAVMAVLGLVVGMIGCGTEDDPTIGIDAGSYTDEAALTNGNCDVVSNALTGHCWTGSGTMCKKSTGLDPACTVGAKPISLALACGVSKGGGYRDTGRTCGQ